MNVEPDPKPEDSDPPGVDAARQMPARRTEAHARRHFAYRTKVLTVCPSGEMSAGRPVDVAIGRDDEVPREAHLVRHYHGHHHGTEPGRQGDPALSASQVTRAAWAASSSTEAAPWA